MCYVFVVETVLPANAVSVMVAEFDIGWWRKCSSSRALVVNLLIVEATSTAQHASLVDYVSVLVIAERGSRWLEVAEFEIGWWRKCSSSRALVANVLIGCTQLNMHPW